MTEPHDLAPEAALALARHPSTDSATLHELASHGAREVRLAVAGNPAAGRRTLAALLSAAGEAKQAGADLVSAILQNPSLPFCLIEEPTWLLRQPAHAAREIARSPALTPALWHALIGHWDERTRVRLWRSPLAGAGRWRELGFASEFDALLVALEGEDRPATQATLAEALITHPDMESRLETRSSWLSNSIALSLARSPALTPALWHALCGHGWTHLRLSLARSPAAPPDAWKLLDLPTEGKWELSSSWLTQEDLEGLLCCPYLDAFTSLNLSGNGLGEEALAVLARGPAFPRLTALHLAHNPLGDAGLTALAQSTSFPLLAKLNLWRTKIGIRGLTALAQSTSFPRLRVLDLSSNELDEMGTLAQSTAFPQLEELDLGFNRLGPLAAAEIAHGAAFSRLTALVLSGNGLGDAGIAALSGGTFPALRELRLTGDQVGTKGIRALLGAPFFPSLTSLAIDLAKLDEASRRLLLDAAAARPHLRLS